jgi:hypothetical protein
MTESPAQDSRSWDLAMILTILAVVVGAVILLLAVVDEPYHIDELRQVRSYDRSFGEIVDASFAQQQPPLDPVLNSLVQRALGPGDVRQRILSVAAGIGSLALLGFLSRRAGLGLGSAVAVLALAISPLLVGVTAYARPYALPLFLMLAFVALSDVWLSAARRWTIPGVIAVSLLLPLSRTGEPILFLGAVIGILLIAWWLRRKEPWAGTPIVPIGAAIAGLGLIAVPVYGRLSEELAEYSETSSISIFDQLSRIWEELPGVASATIPAFLFVVGTFAIWVAMSDARRALTDRWWFWVLAAVPVGFILTFFLRTPLTQPYYARYTFSWVPVIALVMGAVTWAAVVRFRRGDRIIPLIVGAVVFVILATTSVRLGEELSTTELADWEAASSLIVAETSPDTIVIFDAVRPLGSYRTPFAGRPRYTGVERFMPLSVHIAENPDLVPPNSPTAIMLLGPIPDVPGWVAFPADDWFTLYVPEEPVIGQRSAAESMLVFAGVLGPDDGAALSMAAIAILVSIGDEVAARDAMNAVIGVSDQDLRDRIESYAVRLGLLAFADR